jgi:hypothetical protein
MSDITKAIACVIAGVVIGFIAAQLQSKTFGGVYSQITQHFYNGLDAGTTGQFAVSSTGAITTSAALTSTAAATFTGLTTSATTTAGGNVDVTTTNAATSTVIVGCVQTYATSTATPIKQMFFASSTLNIDGASITAGFGGGTQQGIVLWGYGKCPRI